jgi:phenylacetate-CoA ligase
MSQLSNAAALAQLMMAIRSPISERARRTNERLKRLLIAAKRVPHYREQMERARYDPVRDFSGPGDLSVLRVTRKSDVKAAPESFLQDNCGALSAYFSDRTSGSTGIPLVVYRSPRERATQIAKWMRVLLLSGYRPTHKVVSFTAPARLSHGQSVLQRFGLFRRCPVNYLDAPERCVEVLAEYQPDVLYGVRTRLLMIAEELERRNVKLSSLKLLMAGGEVIDAETRRVCRAAYGVDVLETYGSIEMGVMAHQRPGENVLSPIDDCTYFEFLDARGNPAQPGELARVVVTDLNGRLMPFIRYDHGDLAIFRYRQNARGERLQVIERIVGRQDDIATLADGRVLMYLDFYDILCAYPGVKRFRIRQHELDRFSVELLSTPEYFQSIHSAVRARMQSLSSLPLRFDLKRVDRIDPDPSGKRRILISDVAAHHRCDAEELPAALKAQLDRFQ